MAKLTANTVVADPKGGYKVLLKGDDVPAWATDQVGSHLVEGGDDAEPTSYDSQTIKDLKAEIDRRNTGRAEEDQIKVDGTKKDDYVTALTADDERAASADESGSES